MGISNHINGRLRSGDNAALGVGPALAGTYAAGRALERGQAINTGDAPEQDVTRPVRTGWAFWKQVLVGTYREIIEDRLLALAAGVVFYGLLAIFPAITALVSSYALFANASTINNHLAMVSTLMPQSAYSIVDEQVTRIVTRTTGDLSLAFFGGLALALWSANAGVKAIVDALNIVYGVRERRSFIRLNLVSLAFTVSALLALLLAFGAIVILPVILSYLPLYGYDSTVMTWLRWPVLFVLVMFGLAILYRFGPNRIDAYWQFASVGAAFATVAWLVGSSLLSWYLGSFANYDATYGSLGAGIGLMMWLWMTAIIVLVGAELNSEVYKAQHPEAARPRAEEGGLGRSP